MSQIKVGDLVVMIRPPCGHSCADLGKVFRVSEIRAGSPHIFCNYCAPVYDAVVALDGGKNKAFYDVPTGCQTSLLKRIPPLDELEREEIVKEITA